MTRATIRSVAPKVIKAALNERATALDNLEASGTIPSARLNLATNPVADTDTIGIGGVTFAFVTALGAADATVQVVVGGTAAATRASLVKAINGTVDATWREATTPFAAAVVADEIDTSRIRVRKAAARGGAAVAASKATSSVALAESITDAADVWDRANLNETGQADALTVAVSSVVITAAMITAGKVYVELPFTPLDFSFTAKASTGVIRATDDLIAIEGNAIKIPLAGGVSPNLQATDIVTIVAVG